jgi:suppressor for copper-sensitivity B
VLFVGNLIGVFEVTFDQLLATILHQKISDSEKKKNIFIPNFLSGVLAVLLATPCSAPLLGSAITFALAQKISIIFLIFFAIGIGFSSPYIALLIFPKLVYLLPKPGQWMLKVKKLMAVLLSITVAWLVYVLSDNIGMMPAFVATILTLLLLLCFEIKAKFFKLLSFVTLLAAIFFLPTNLEKKSLAPMNKENSQNIWINFDEKLLYQLVAEGRTVVIDVTADWCITCKVNKLTVLNSKEIVAKLSAPNIVAMRADITKPNEEVMIFLRKHGRFAIPFNAVYGSRAKKGILASEFLTKKELSELIDKASN